jgi:hypothetical protein
MQVFLAALNEMKVHFVFWLVRLLLLWRAEGQFQRMGKAWIAIWEQKHNTSISTFIRSQTRIGMALAFLTWAVMLITLLVLGRNWTLLQFLLLH